jgi:outer membrane immunogenic protein
MKRILLAGVAAFGLVGTSSAADLAVKAPVAYVPLFTWTGCYLGANGGWIGGGDKYHTEERYGFYDKTKNGYYAAVSSPFSFSSDESAGTVGGQFGCQFQTGSWVIGSEWDWNWTGLKEDTALSSLDPFEESYFQVDQATHKQFTWFSTARARLGFAWDRVMIYATGGLAYASYDAYTQVDWDVNRDYEDLPFYYRGGYHENRFGYAVGGGLEWAFANNWTAKAEFLYLDFGSFDFKSPVDRLTSDELTDFTYDAWHTRVDAKEYVARIGINYLFHTGGAPVVARY